MAQHADPPAAEADSMAAGWRTVRARLQALVLVPGITVLILAGTQTRDAYAQQADARRAEALAGVAVAATELVHLLDRELAEAQALRDRGGRTGEPLVRAAQARTRAATTRFAASAARAAPLATGLRAPLAEAGAAMAAVGAARPKLWSSPPFDAAYRAGAGAVLAVAESLPEQIAEPELARRARAAAALAGAAHTVAVQRDLLRGAASRKALSTAELTALARLDALAAERIAGYRRTATTDEVNQGRARLTGPDVVAATAIRGRVLAGGAGRIGVDADAWYVAASHTIRALHDVELELSTALAGAAAALAGAAQRRLALTVVSVGLALGLSVVTTALLATRTSTRLRRLRAAALAAAADLPPTLAALGTAADPIAVRDDRLAAAAARGARLASRPDEIGHVAAALTDVHREALRLAADAAVQRADAAAVLVALSRRNQRLIGRQLDVIDRLEAEETDPDRLATLFHLDHLAARMRRNDDNLLVIAGGQPGRRFTEPVALGDVVRAAAAEIEDYPRVEYGEIPDVAVAGHAAGDVVHLLSELIENAAVHSPARAPVTIAAASHVDTVRVWINDGGAGMSPAAMNAANHHLTYPATLTAALAGTMGLLVVSRLAARHAIEVSLHPLPHGGISALVTLPIGALSPLATAAGPTRVHRSHRRPEAPHRRPGALPATAYPAAGGGT
ncbi:MAG TPA: ATP-binding protein [Pilimelia sp.]|nr:ATP-binding protein [Pilimelia sp.]